MYKILLVDDEQNVLNALRRELQSEYSVEAFNDPRAALQRCGETGFDLVVADYKMPEMNGIEFLKQFGKLQPDAARIMLSGQADFNALIGTINETHIYRFLGKPWDQTELATTLAEALAHREQMQTNRRLAEQLRMRRNWQPARDPHRVHQVLVVDDEPNIVSAIARDINTRGGFRDMQMVMSYQADPSQPLQQRDLRFNVHTATSALQALKDARQNTYDAVIADYLMPEMDGLEFFAALREIQPDAVRILISGRANTTALVNAINRSEIYSYISKPWHEYALNNTLAQAIAYRELLHENRLLVQHEASQSTTD